MTKNKKQTSEGIASHAQVNSQHGKGTGRKEGNEINIPPFKGITHSNLVTGFKPQIIKKKKNGTPRLLTRGNDEPMLEGDGRDDDQQNIEWVDKYAECGVLGADCMTGHQISEDDQAGVAWRFGYIIPNATKSTPDSPVRVDAAGILAQIGNIRVVVTNRSNYNARFKMRCRTAHVDNPSVAANISLSKWYTLKGKQTRQVTLPGFDPNNMFGPLVGWAQVVKAEPPKPAYYRNVMELLNMAFVIDNIDEATGNPFNTLERMVDVKIHVGQYLLKLEDLTFGGASVDTVNDGFIIPQKITWKDFNLIPYQTYIPQTMALYPDLRLKAYKPSSESGFEVAGYCYKVARFDARGRAIVNLKIDSSLVSQRVRLSNWPGHIFNGVLYSDFVVLKSDKGFELVLARPGPGTSTLNTPEEVDVSQCAPLSCAGQKLVPVWDTKDLILFHQNNVDGLEWSFKDIFWGVVSVAHTITVWGQRLAPFVAAL